MRFGGLALLLAATAVLAGCGSGDSSSSETTAGTSAHTLRLPTGGGPAGREAATDVHLSATDCAALRKLAEAQVGRELDQFVEPTPPASRCRLTASGARIGIYLDAGRSARQRYKNRMTEQNQFGAPDPGKVVHPVANVGDPAPGNPFASWVPNLGSLFAVRDNRWCTVAYTVDGVRGPAARSRAAELARLAFRLTAS